MTRCVKERTLGESLTQGARCPFRNVQCRVQIESRIFKLAKNLPLYGGRSRQGRLQRRNASQYHTITPNPPFTEIATMLLSSLALISTFLLPLQTLAHNIQLNAHSRECFHENLHKDDKMTVTFQIGDREFGGSGSLEVDFWVQLTSYHAFGPPLPPIL